MTINSFYSKPPVTLTPLTRDAAENWLGELTDRAALCEPGSPGALLPGMLGEHSELEAFLGSVFSLSSHLRDICIARPEQLASLLSTEPGDFASELIATVENLGKTAGSEAQLMEGLRIAKKQLALFCGLLDLGQWWHGEQVTALLADLADASLKAALDFLLLAMHNSGKVELANPENPQEGSGLVVLGMGKHGARELNYSSDIDIIIFFETDAKLVLKTDDPTTLYSRMAKQLVRIMQERTGDGYVFRTDLRLRPDPGSTPLAIPVLTALNYYEAYGQNWERAALIKARPVAGDIEAGRNLLKELAPFVWRKYLDFAAIQDVHSIKRQIHAHKGHGEIAIHGHNVKLGRGGIREIEFFAQTQQLIAGGRVPELRKLKTLDALATLQELDWISAQAREELTSAYWYLRNVEHRLQMVADEQTHTLPTDDEELRRIALMMGDDGVAEFSDNLTHNLKMVERHYADLFEASPELTIPGGNLVFTGDDEDPATLETLTTMGFKRPSDIIRTVRGWHYSRFPALQTAQARELLTELTPSLIGEISRTDAPDETLFAMDRFISGLPAGIQLFSLLKTNAALSRLLVLILGSAPRLADIITRKPHVFDGLLDPAFAEGVPDAEMLHERYAQALARSPDYESSLDLARVFAAEQKFLIGVRLLNGIIDAGEAGKAYADLADVLIDGMLSAVRQEFEKRHGTVSGGRICILGMGRLGSRELTVSSDLDLILLYDHDEDADYSSGPKELSASQYFIRLTQRMIAAMSAPTAEGVMYELDFRLRPSGNAGPLATPFASFSKYQRNEAWVWETQALTRARAVAGDHEFCQIVDNEICEIVSTERDHGKIASEVLKMRKLIDKEKGSDNPWHVKTVPGGLIDLEFIGQWASMTSVESTAGETDRSIGAMLSRADNAGFLETGDHEVLAEALAAYSAIIQISRLCLGESYDPETAPGDLTQTICDTLNQPDPSVATAYLRDTQRDVRKIFNRLLGKPANRGGETPASGDGQ